MRSVAYHWYRENRRAISLLRTQCSVGQGYTSQAEEAGQPTAHVDRCGMNEGQMQESKVEVEGGKKKKKTKL